MSSSRRAAAGNLPLELSSFVGRRRELDKVKRLIADSRLVTLTGVGGAGKTRLSLRVAASLRRAFHDGAWFVDLAELRDPDMLTREFQDVDVLAYLVAVTLGLGKQASGPPLRLLTTQLADRQTLLILDNCEHLLSAVTVLANTLLTNCPGLRILATSREPLAVDGESVFPVPPLATPDPRQQSSAAALVLYEAVALFVARAQMVRSEFRLTDDNRVAVVEICHQLDGLPLAIELAAARIRALAPEQILGRLAHRFALLNRGSRDAPRRQQTLRACVDWSHELCSKPERVLWARLSVFAGGFDLDAVVGVCADDVLPGYDMLELVATLVDKSILVRDGGQGEHARYRLLDSLRDYGQEKLNEYADDTSLRCRHRDWYQQLVALGRTEWISNRQGYWLDRLTREHANLRAAVEYCLAEPGEAGAALTIAVTLPTPYWWGGRLGEGRRWLDRASEQSTEPTALRARALVLACHLALNQGETGAAMRLLDQGDDLARRLGTTVVRAYAALIRGFKESIDGDHAQALSTFELGLTFLSTASPSEVDMRVQLLNVLAVTAALAGDYERTIAWRQEMLDVTEPRGEVYNRSAAVMAGGLAHWLHGDQATAATQVVESLRLKRAGGLNDPWSTAFCLEILAWITASRRRYRRAAVLLGAAEGIRLDIGFSFTSYRHMVGYHDACQHQVRDVLGDAGLTEALGQGRSLALGDALAYAVDERSPTVRRSAEGPASLTRREREVAALVARGLTDKQIATTLVISPRTAESHVEHILIKLAFTNRAQVAAWTAAQGASSHNSRPSG